MSASEASRIEVDDQSPATAAMRADVLAALRQDRKELPSLYLYDERGAKLFEEICETEEYYPTNTELGILETHLAEMAELIGPGALVIEPGSGSGMKTELLLGHLYEPAGYVPVDIACEQLADVAHKLNEKFVALEVLPVCADFMSDFDLPTCTRMPRRRIVYIPGSTIGNFKPQVARQLLAQMHKLVGTTGGVLLGVDVKKDAKILEPAYDDADGVSGRFAMNYLERLNRELGADFDISQFVYTAPYNVELGRIEMGLVSQRDQVVHIGDEAVRIRAREKLYTEYSYKYAPEEFAEFAGTAGFHVRRVWMDRNRLFSVQLLEPAAAA